MKENVNFIEENKVVLKTLFLFFFFVVIFYVLLYDLVNRIFLREFTAQIVAFLLNLSGFSASVDGYFINMHNNFSLEVIYECVGIWAMIVYSSFVLAYPTDLKKKLIGIAFGVPGLYAIGIVRMAVLAVIGVYYPNMWEYAHVYFWQLSLIIFVILLLLLWVEKVVKIEQSK